MEPVDLLPLIAPHLVDGPVAVPDDGLADAVARLLGDDREIVRGALATLPDGRCGAALLLAGEVASAGVAGATLVSEAVRVCRAGGVVAIAGPSAVHQRLITASDADGAASLPSAELSHLLAHRGLELLLEAAPGAAAAVAGREWAGLDDLELDRLPGLRDAGPMALAVGRTPRTAGERSGQFFASIARKIVSSSVACVDEDGLVLLVFDSFRSRWTLPGGLVDAEEHPAEAAIRESLEEGGVPVALDGIGGVFAHPYPDRVQLIYLAHPTARVPDPHPIHTHEIAAVRWVARAEAERLLDPDMRRRLTLSLDEPGGTWQW